MNTRLMAFHYIKRARNHFKESIGAFNDEDFPKAVRLSQQCVQLSLKAALSSVAVIAPFNPFKHDLTDIFFMVNEKFPDWFSSKVPEFIDVADDLKKRTTNEGEFFSSKKDATDAIKGSEEIFNDCKKLINEVFKDI